MSNNQAIEKVLEARNEGNSIQIIQSNLSDPAEGLYAVCTPVKIK